MSIWGVALAFTALPAITWLLILAERWWRWGNGAEACSSPAGHRQRMADWQRRIEEAQRLLDYYLATPDWFDAEWPICDHVSISDDGQYCRNCYRQVADHGIVAGVAA